MEPVLGLLHHGALEVGVEPRQGELHLLPGLQAQRRDRVAAALGDVAKRCAASERPWQVESSPRRSRASPIPAPVHLAGGGADDVDHRLAADPPSRVQRRWCSQAPPPPAGRSCSLRLETSLRSAGHFVRRCGGLGDIAGDLGRGGALLLDRRGDRSGDRVDLADGFLDAADRVDRCAGGGANLGDMAADLLGGTAPSGWPAASPRWRRRRSPCRHRRPAPPR